MQKERIFFAPSLLEVIRQLLIYRPSGVLTIWRAIGPRQEDAVITIEHGYPTYVFRGAHRETAGEAILAWLNSWGELHFSFISTETRLALPPPRQAQPLVPETPSPVKSAPLPPIASMAQPFQAISYTSRAPNTSATREEPEHDLSSTGKFKRTYELPTTQAIRQQEEQADGRAHEIPLPSMAPEKVIASLTQSGKNYSASNLPRYERTIFLLVNGRRTVVDLAQLTKRSLEDVYTTLYRLQSLQLVTVASVPDNH